MQSNSCEIKTSNNPKSFKYESFDLLSDYSISIRGISLASHRSSTIIISSHGITAYQHHDVVLQSQPHGIDSMRCNITCSLCLFPCSTRTVCSTSLTNGCTVTCRVFFRLYCWRVRLFCFCLTGEFDCYWVTVEGGSNCGGGGVNDLIDGDGLALNIPSSLVVSLFVIAYISRLKLFIIACRALIVTGVSAAAAWFVDILLNNRIT